MSGQVIQRKSTIATTGGRKGDKLNDKWEGEVKLSNDEGACLLWPENR